MILGKQLAIQLIAEGFEVVITVRSNEAGRRVRNCLPRSDRDRLTWVILRLQSVDLIQKDVAGIMKLHRDRLLSLEINLTYSDLFMSLF